MIADARNKRRASQGAPCFNYQLSILFMSLVRVKQNLLLISSRRRNGREALGNEFAFRLAGLVCLCLLEGLATTGATLANHLELAHVFAIALDLLLLGVNAASVQGSTESERSSSEERRTRGESLTG